MTHRCQHVEAMKRLLREEGATDVATAREGNKIRVSWRVGGRPSFTTVPALPRDVVVARNSGRQAVRRMCRELRTS